MAIPEPLTQEGHCGIAVRLASTFRATRSHVPSDSAGGSQTGSSARPNGGQPPVASANKDPSHLPACRMVWTSPPIVIVPCRSAPVFSATE